MEEVGVFWTGLGALKRDGICIRREVPRLLCATLSGWLNPLRWG